MMALTESSLDSDMYHRVAPPVALVWSALSFAWCSAATDITGEKFVAVHPDCRAYVGSYVSTANDHRAPTKPFHGSVEISSADGYCYLVSNSVPNHRFNDGKDAFPPENAFGPVIKTYRFPVNPTAASTITELSQDYDVAVFLNGIKFDALAAECWTMNDVQADCQTVGGRWRYDPMHPSGDFVDFKIDRHNAHVQPNGEYHYHGAPWDLYAVRATKHSGVLGFAADGFPIYGPVFVDKLGKTRLVKSGYQLRSGERPSPGHGGPGMPYNGEFRDDYVFSRFHGDLDRCNGMLVNGSYRYYVTSEFPYGPACFRGTPDESFDKAVSVTAPVP